MSHRLHADGIRFELRVLRGIYWRRRRKEVLGYFQCIHITCICRFVPGEAEPPISSDNVAM